MVYQLMIWGHNLVVTCIASAGKTSCMSIPVSNQAFSLVSPILSAHGKQPLFPGWFTLPTRILLIYHVDIIDISINIYIYIPFFGGWFTLPAPILMTELVFPLFPHVSNQPGLEKK